MADRTRIFAATGDDVVRLTLGGVREYGLGLRGAGTPGRSIAACS
jgi:hypothetical protein